MAVALLIYIGSWPALEAWYDAQIGRLPAWEEFRKVRVPDEQNGAALLEQAYASVEELEDLLGVYGLGWPLDEPEKVKEHLPRLEAIVDAAGRALERKHIALPLGDTPLDGGLGPISDLARALETCGRLAPERRVQAVELLLELARKYRGPVERVVRIASTWQAIDVVRDHLDEFAPADAEVLARALRDLQPWDAVRRELRYERLVRAHLAAGWMDGRDPLADSRNRMRETAGDLRDINAEAATWLDAFADSLEIPWYAAEHARPVLYGLEIVEQARLRRAARALLDADAARAALRSGWLPDAVTPVVGQALAHESRVRLARCALAIHAHVRRGTALASLSDYGVPVEDPLTGRPFEYAVDADKIVLESTERDPGDETLRWEIALP